MTEVSPAIPLLFFADQRSFTEWLDKHYQILPAVWVKIYKKASGITSITYDEALDVALCYGWIDSQMKGYAVIYPEIRSAQIPQSVVRN